MTHSKDWHLLLRVKGFKGSLIEHWCVSLLCFGHSSVLRGASRAEFICRFIQWSKKASIVHSFLILAEIIHWAHRNIEWAGVGVSQYALMTWAGMDSRRLDTTQQFWWWWIKPHAFHLNTCFSKGSEILTFCTTWSNSFKLSSDLEIVSDFEY